jgi:hypothetical protein
LKLQEATNTPLCCAKYLLCFGAVVAHQIEAQQTHAKPPREALQFFAPWRLRVSMQLPFFAVALQARVPLAANVTLYRLLPGDVRESQRAALQPGSLQLEAANCQAIGAAGGASALINSSLSHQL